MINVKTLTIFFATVCCCVNSYAQGNTIIDHINEKDGLSYRWVFDITQDHNGFIWFATFDGLDRYDGTNFVSYKHSRSDTNSISTNQVFHVTEDDQGGIWTYGSDLVFNRIDLVSGKVARIKSFFRNDTLYSRPRQIMIDFGVLANGEFVVAFRERELGQCSFWKYRPDKKRFDHILDVPTQTATINYFSERDDGKIWLWGMGGGYYLVDVVTHHMEYFPVNNIGLKTPRDVEMPVDINRDFWYPSNHDAKSPVPGRGGLKSFRIPDNIDLDKIGHIRLDNRGGIWMNYGDYKLYRFDSKNELLEEFVDPVFGARMDYRATKRVFADQEGAYWNGHFFGAIRFTNRPELFNKYLVQSIPGDDPDMDGFSARDIIEITPAKLLVRENQDDLFIIDRVTGRTKQFQRKPWSISNLGTTPGIHSMFLSKDGFLWSNQSDKLDKTNLETGEFKSYQAFKYPYSEYPRIFEDRSENLWWCNDDGLYIFDRLAEKIVPVEVKHPVPSVDGSFRYGSYDPAEDAIYGTYDRGVYIIDCKNKSSTLLEIFSDKEGDFQITAILKWGNEFWLSSDNGLVRYNPETNDRVVYTRKDGLPSDIIYSALGAGNDLWLATHNGLCQFNPGNLQVTTYYREQGLPHDEFNRWSYLKTQDGHLFFGSLNGVIGFDPMAFTIPETKKGHLNLVEFSKYNQQGNEHIVIENRANTPIEKIVIEPHERTVSFRYMLSIFEDTEKNQYFHFMEGLERDWIEDGNQANARYILIPPGNYTFRVKAAGPDKVFASNQIAVPIVVRQYWYLRWWAITGYVFLIAIGIGMLYRFQLYRRLDKQEAKRARELEEIKTKMYTNITHEFRTPLTVMLGMNDAVRNYTKEREVEKVLRANEMIERNGQNLLNLVNQMLDLSKLESGMLNVDNKQGDIVEYLKYNFESFQSYAAEKSIHIHFLSEDDEIIMDFDTDKLSHIIGNLISNAIKFTPENGSIGVNVKRVENDKAVPYLEMKVSDTGIGIEEDRIGDIFNRFYQVGDTTVRRGEGTGIGLSLVKEVVKLLDGTIRVESKINKGSEFIVLLPITNKAPFATSQGSSRPVSSSGVLAASTENDDAFLNEDQGLPLVLIVEDNADVLHYIRVSIKDIYRTVVATDGGEGIDKAIELIPDVIISDVMMPVKDGFELCAAVKKDERTSHIPVILLTAKMDQDSKIEGLEQGADAYVAKPFDKKELLIRVKNLLALRVELQKRYAQTDFSKPINGYADVEDAFLLKIRSLVLDHIDVEDFSISELCKISHLSRAQLHRKLTALTGQSTSHLIRAVRLEKARELLAGKQLSVSEVAYQVGFKTQAHFSRVFSEAFGMPPSDYQKK